MGESLPTAPKPSCTRCQIASPVGGQLEGFPHPDIISRRTVGANPRQVMRVGGNVDRVEAIVAGEVEKAEVVEPQDAISHATLYGGNRGLLVIEKEELKPFYSGRAAPIMPIGFHNRAVARQQLFHDEGAAAIEYFARFLSAGFEYDDLVLREPIEKIRIGRFDVEDDSMIAGGSDRLDARKHISNRASGVKLPLDAPNNIVRGQQRAIMEARALHQPKGIAQAIFAALPR